MNVFVSWSGERSKAVADLLDDWLQCVLQALDPWMSSRDIDRGSLWFSEINEQLQDTSIGIICLTQENKGKPWILFEAGALAKGLSDSRVCTFLIDLGPIDIGTPLSQFNHTLPEKESMFQLVRTLNNTLKERGLKEKILEDVFETYWPQFENKFQKILKDYPVGEESAPREESDILKEILSVTRGMEARVRRLESKRSIEVRNASLEPRSLTEQRFSSTDVPIKEFLKTNLYHALEDEQIINLLKQIYGISDAEAMYRIKKARNDFNQ